MTNGPIKAVLGPTNTGKTHLAIERLCAHSSGAIGFPLRLLAREVYDRVVAIKGPREVALITGEERIEPPNARWLLCTAEAMPRTGGDRAFVALDEAQLAADRERGHLFTDRLLNARGREETMLLGSATLEPMVRALVPEAEIVTRPRFSTLKHLGPRKLSRLPPRSAIVAFSVEQVYTVAEMLRRFRGGAAVVMGALSPQTRNRQVELFQSGEVDYIVATDAIGMGLNLDVTHVAFAGLSKFDGVSQRRLTSAEMAQIAGRAGRHQKDGTFGTLAGVGSRGGEPPEFADEEVYGIEEHRFPPLTQLYWREPQPRFDSIATLIADLESGPLEPGLKSAPEAIDLAVLKRLADEPLGAAVRGAGSVRRFWEACSLPDFRQLGADAHARFVGRLWQDLRGGYVGADYVAARIAELDRTQGDIDTLQGRIAAIRSWAYICQRPDWVLARDEMAARARAAEAKLSDALHARLTERFVNRRTAILMKTFGPDTGLLPVELAQDGHVSVEGEPIGQVEGFRFTVDPAAGAADHRMLLSAAEKALPRLLEQRADALIDGGLEGVALEGATLRWHGRPLARVERTASVTAPRLVADRELALLPEAATGRLMAALEGWLAKAMAPLAPLAQLEAAARDPAQGSQARALLLTLVEGQGFVARDAAGLEHLPKELRPALRRLGVTIGALDVYAPALMKPGPRRLFRALGLDPRPLQDAMLPVIDSGGRLPAGYRKAGAQAVRIDIAEKLLRAAHDARATAREGAADQEGQAARRKAAGKAGGKAGGGIRRRFMLDPALPISTGLLPENWRQLLAAAGFRFHPGRRLAPGAFGPAAPDGWEWRPLHRPAAPPPPAPPPATGAFAALAGLVR